MTNLEQAYNHIENLRIADFFTFVEPFAKDTTSRAMLERLQESFILGKTDVGFHDQLRSLANLLFTEKQMDSKKNILKNYLVVTLKSAYANDNTQESMRIFIDNWAKCLMYINQNFDDFVGLIGISDFYSTSLQFRDIMQDISKRNENGETIRSLTNQMLNEIRIILENI